MSNQKSKVIGKARINNNVHLNAFDLSNRVIFGSSVGQLSPIDCVETLPNEKYSINKQWFTRAQTLVSNSYGRFVENVQTFFVPFSSILRSYPMRALPTTQKNAAGFDETRFVYNRGGSAPLDTSLPYVTLRDILFVIIAYAVYEHAAHRYAVETSGFPATSETIVPFTMRFTSLSGMLRSVSVARLMSYLGIPLGLDDDTTPLNSKLFSPYVKDSSHPDRQVTITYKNQLTGLQRFVMWSMTADAIQKLAGSWMNMTNYALSPMRLLAYHKIYNDFYRNDTWQPYNAQTCNVDYMDVIRDMRLKFPLHPSQGHFTALSVRTFIDKWTFTTQSKQTWAQFEDAYFKEFFDFTDISKASWCSDINVLDERVCNLPLDSVNGVLPTPQYGDAAVANATFTGNFLGLTEHDVAYSLGLSIDSASEDGNGTPVISMRDEPPIQVSSSVSVKDLRVAESLQKFKEISLSHDAYFMQQIKAHFGIEPSYDPFKSYLIGGQSTTIQVDTQVNQNLSDGNNAVLGGIASAQGSYSCNYLSRDYGVLMTIHTIYPILDYTNRGVEQQVLTVDGVDLPVPEFDNNGFEGRRNLNAAGVCPTYYTDSPSAVYGYAPRYFDYKIRRDVVLGDLAFTQKDKVLASSNLNDNSVDVIQRCMFATPFLCDNVFANNQHLLLSDEMFYTNMSDGIGATRPFSIHSLPYAN